MNRIKPTGFLLAILISATAFAQEKLGSVLDNPVQGGQKETSQCTDCCGAILNSEYLAQMQRMQGDGTWYEATNRDLSGVRGTTYVATTFHILRNSNGTGGMEVSLCQYQINHLNTHVAGSGLEFCIQEILFHDLADPTVTYPNSPTIGFIPNTMNVYCTPYIDHDFGLCGYASYPPYNTFVVQNNCMEPGTTTFSHETGHYFGLPHTFAGTENGSNPECVDGSNCLTGGDGICDTAADDNGGWGGACNYVGGGVDACNGDPYSPNTDNLMSYSWDFCVDEFTNNQLSLFLSIAETYRSSHLSSETCVPSTGACCNESGACLETYEDACNSVGWNWQGLGTVCENGCEQNVVGACCIGEQCIQVPMQNCLAAGATWIGGGIPCEDGVCDQEPCEGDIDVSGTVDVGDLLAVIDQWGSTDSPADVTGDGVVNVSDLLLIISNWGPCD